MRYVTLADGTRVTLLSYVRTWRAAIAEPGAELKRGIADRWPVRGGELLRDLRRGLHERINRHIPGYGRGRKWDSDWQGEMIYNARLLNTPRLRLSWLPADLRMRFAHRIRRSED